jgi:uncharacterized protein YcbX
MPIATVARFNVTPVKSTRLHHPEEIRIEPHGAVGNRDFFFVDEDGRRLSGERKHPLLVLESSYDAAPDRIALRTPDGLVAEGPAAGGPEAVVADFWGRSVPAHVVEGDFEELLTRFVGRPTRLARVDRPGDATDVRALTLVSLASVEELSRQGGRDTRVDPTRFRMTIEVEGCAPHEEDRWSGRSVRLGGAVIGIGQVVPRCVVTTLDPATGVRDFPTLSVINGYRERTPKGQLPFGVYADVVEPGTVRVGDPLELV